MTHGYGFDAAKWDEILRRVSEGEPTRHICRGEDMPSVTALRDWRKAEGREIEYRAAKADGTDVIIERARQTLRGKGPADGGESTSDVVRDKAIAEFDLKLASKFDPRYSDRQDVNLHHSGEIAYQRIERKIIKPGDASTA